jgi:hypothetical protein
VAAQAVDDVGIVLGAGAALGDEEMTQDAELGCGFETVRICNVGDDDGDFYAGQTAFADGLRDGEEVRAAAGEQDA